MHLPPVWHFLICAQIFHKSTASRMHVLVLYSSYWCAYLCMFRFIFKNRFRCSSLLISIHFKSQNKNTVYSQYAVCLQGTCSRISCLYAVCPAYVELVPGLEGVGRLAGGQQIHTSPLGHLVTENHRRRINTKVVTAAWGTQLLQFLATLPNLHHDN